VGHNQELHRSNQVKQQYLRDKLDPSIAPDIDQNIAAAPPKPSSTGDRFFRTDHLKTNLGGRTARGGTLAVATQALKFFLTIGATSVMARLLSPQDYGLIGMVAFVTAFVSTYKDLGLAAATIQRPEITSEQVSTLFWINLALSAGITVFTIAVAPLVSWFYGEPRLTAITIITAFGFIISGLTVQHEALLRRQMRYVSLSIVNIVSMLVGYVVGITMAVKGFSYWALVGSQLAVAGSTTLLILFFCRWIPGLPRRDTGVRSMMRFGGNLTGFATINFFSRNLDNLLIGWVWGPQQLGIYSRAYQLMMLPIEQINEPMTSVAVPTLSRLMDDGPAYRRAYLRMLEKVALITMPGIALLIVTVDWVVMIVLGPQWTEVGTLLVILGITGMVQPISNTTGWLFISQGRTKEMFNLAKFGGPITMASIVAGLPWGAKGVATSYVAMHLLLIHVTYWYVGKKGPVRTLDIYRIIGTFALPSICGMGASFAFRYWYQPTNPWLGILECLVITGITTLLVLTILPSGRNALRDVLRAVALLRSSSASPIATT
jgi:O-antigen/teichoic acid export membrane protein